jgi:acetyl-CoA carboxylase biotin carboxyl carrier protein
MYKFEELCELIRLVGSSGVAGVEVEHAGSRVRIEGRATVMAGPAAADAAAPATADNPGAVEQAAGAAPAADAAAAADDGLHEIASPIVGTFYRAPSPDADPYVKVGDFIERGQVLCIVEAMKLMNEIESDVRGTVVKVLPENAQPVEFGATLFVIRPD